MEYYYARVSSKEQNLDRQIEEFKKLGAPERNIITDKQSGKDFNRPGYNSLVGTATTTPLLREGDLLIIYSIDRLGRNYTEILREWQRITKEIKADIRVLDMPLLDTSVNEKNLDSTFVADLVLQILSYVANKERDNNKTRQAQGIAAAKAKGKHLGRPKAEYPAEWQHYYIRWKNKDITAVQCMKELSLTRNTFYNLVKRYETNKN
jgi:DNA invertase Pin-like site-specific DNA recombinase